MKHDLNLAQVLADSGISLADERGLIRYLKALRVYPCTTEARWLQARIDAWNIRQMHKVLRLQISAAKVVAECRENVAAFAWGFLGGLALFACAYSNASAAMLP